MLFTYVKKELYAEGCTNPLGKEKEKVLENNR